MLLNVLDDTFRRVDPIIDTFTSLIWTERYNEAGDITLVFPDAEPLRSTIVEGVFLSLPESREVMMVDTVSTENKIITVTGPTLSGFLSERMMSGLFGNDPNGTDTITGTAGAIAAVIVSEMCITGGVVGTIFINGADEIIPGLALGDISSAGDTYSFQITNSNVYDAVKSVLDVSSLGFTVYPPSLVDGSGDLVFEVYAGRDVSTDQDTFPAVIFSPALDSFTDIKELRSTSAYKNTAWVLSGGVPIQRVRVYDPAFSGATGWTRRTIVVDASDLTYADYGANLTAMLTQKGLDALANNNYVRVVDGQVVPQSAFQYGRDYKLGDVIELRGNSGIIQKARVTEYIRAQDSTGYKEYPTLSVIS